MTRQLGRLRGGCTCSEAGPWARVSLDVPPPRLTTLWALVFVWNEKELLVKIESFFSYCTERGWWCWCEWGMLLCKEVPKKGRPGSKKFSSKHCKWNSLSCNFTSEAFVKTSTWDHMGLAPSTRGRWIPQSQLWWAEIFSLFFCGGEVGTRITFSESSAYHISLYQFPPQRWALKK